MKNLKIHKISEENIILIDEIANLCDRLEIEKHNLRQGINTENDLPARDNAMINIVTIEKNIKEKKELIKSNFKLMIKLAKG